MVHLVCFAVSEVLNEREANIRQKDSALWEQMQERGKKIQRRLPAEKKPVSVSDVIDIVVSLCRFVGCSVASDQQRVHHQQ